MVVRLPRYHWWVVFSPTLFTFSHHTHFLLFYIKQKRYHCPQHLSYSWIMAPAFSGPGIDSEKNKKRSTSTKHIQHFGIFAYENVTNSGHNLGDHRLHTRVGIITKLAVVFSSYVSSYPLYAQNFSFLCTVKNHDLQVIS